MKSKINLLSICFIAFTVSLFAQNKPYNPYKSIGKEAKVLTLSNGKYEEFFDTDTIEVIGSAILNTKTMKVIGFVEQDTMYSEATLEPEVVSRFLSIDPLARKFPYLTPYQYAANTPIQAVDLDGLEQLDANFLFAIKQGKTTIQGVSGIRYDFNENTLTFGISHGQVGAVTATFDFDKKTITNFAILDNDIGAKDRFDKTAGFKVPAFLAASEFKKSLKEIDFGEFKEDLKAFNTELEGLGLGSDLISVSLVTSTLKGIADKLEAGTIETRLLNFSTPDVIKSVENEQTGIDELKEFEGGKKVRFFKSDKTPLSFDKGKVLIDVVIDFVDQTEKEQD